MAAERLRRAERTPRMPAHARPLNPPRQLPLLLLLSATAPARTFELARC